MNHIELFAGCGGLSLGLERAGFELTLANELSPMAGETFAFNLLGEELSALEGKKSNNAYWLSSQHDDITPRLRENPFAYPAFGEGVSDIPVNPDDMQGKLVIGNIIQLNELLRDNLALKDALKDGFGQGGVDLVSGGPPCQSFSLAGLRKKDCDKNSLPWEFATFVDQVRPKIAMLENVTGILRGFKEKDEDGNSVGESYYAWFEVAKAFAGKGYIPLCLHVNARLAGVPQNRPRFIMIGVREDVYEGIRKNLNNTEKEMFSHGEKLFCKIKEGQEVAYGTYPYFDAQKSHELGFFQKSFLHHLVDKEEVSVSKAIGDLKFNSKSIESRFVKNLNNTFTGILGKTNKQANHEERNNTLRVKRRFRIYQVIQQCGKRVAKEISSYLRHGGDISGAAWEALRSHRYLIGEDEYISFSNKQEFLAYLADHATKKQTQKALCAEQPAPAALSIPDDACHYDEGELRNLTVREMARIQSFPDNFQFRSKVTTGGKMRRFEVPQYTQVGNAVPPLLGLALGEAIKELLDKQ
ncbi:DNA cytosine methyltransferase [Parendozoicomonas sp. Alg238-R29]|uniref:DNA cytosine methyltransferase n=1 Tax=Parendozoicomonas sp. Alg238-R29 TaxID=2993446 RepID=UPI00248DF365|nr:DNA cytosine methyltransferase [Parendozoicomonas sp. Alg238-R29]